MDADVPGLNPYDGYFRSSVDGRWYAWHFWLVPALSAPIQAALDLSGAEPLRAFELLNAMLLALVMWSVACVARLEPPQRLLLAGLTLFSPLVWYVSWPSAEVFAAGMVIIAICAWTSGMRLRAVLFAALAATQNPSMLLLVAVLAVRAMWDLMRSGDKRRAPLAIAASLPALLPWAFYTSLFGTGNLIREAGMASAKYVTPGKIVDFFLSLDQGLLPYAPVALALGLIASIRASRQSDRWGLARLLVVLIAVTITATTIEWNSDAVGLRRHALWILPMIVWLAVDLAGADRRVSRIVPGLVAAQMLIAALWVFPPGMADHSMLCEFTLAHVAWLKPVPEAFAPRTLHLTEPLSMELPVCLVPEDGATRILVDDAHLDRIERYVELSPTGRDALTRIRPAGDGLYWADLPEGSVSLRTQSRSVPAVSSPLISELGGPSPYGGPFERFNRLGVTARGVPSVAVDAGYPVYVTATNDSASGWYPSGSHPIGVRVEVSDAAGRRVTSAGPFPVIRAVMPGEKASFFAAYATPARPGVYLVTVSLVQSHPDGTESILASSPTRHRIATALAPEPPS